MAASLARRAQSCTRPKANAVCECSPARMGCVSFGSHVLNCAAAVNSRGASASSHRRAAGSSHSRSSAASCSSHADPYGRSKPARPGARK